MHRGEIHTRYVSPEKFSSHKTPLRRSKQGSMCGVRTSSKKLGEWERVLSVTGERLNMTDVALYVCQLACLSH